MVMEPAMGLLAGKSVSALLSWCRSLEELPVRSSRSCFLAAEYVHSLQSQRKILSIAFEIFLRRLVPRGSIDNTEHRARYRTC